MAQGMKYIRWSSPNLTKFNAVADGSAFIKSVPNSQHNVDVCINSALAETIEENGQYSLMFISVFYFVDCNSCT